MKLLDWYIIKKFIVTFLFCIIAMTALVVIVDLSEKTDDFAKTGLSAKDIMVQYYFAFIPRMDAMLFPLFIFISVVFFTSKMANRSEVVAMLSTGISFRRFLQPFFFAGLFFTVSLWAINHFVLPQANGQWSDFSAKYINDNYGNVIGTSTISNKYFKLDQTSYAGVKYYDTTTRSGSNFVVQKFDSATNMIRNLYAQNIRWDTATHSWELSRVRMRIINGLKQTLKDTSVLHAYYNFQPIDLKADSRLKDRMTTHELNRFIHMERMRGSEDLNSLILEKQNRNAIPITVLVLTLIGAIIASQKTRGGSGVHLAIGFLICVLYVLVSRFSSVFAVQAEFNPVIAAWLPNVLFGALAYYLYWREVR